MADAIDFERAEFFTGGSGVCGKARAVGDWGGPHGGSDRRGRAEERSFARRGGLRMMAHYDRGMAVGAVKAARGVRLKKRIVLGVRWLPLGCILLVRK